MYDPIEIEEYAARMAELVKKKSFKCVLWIKILVPFVSYHSYERQHTNNDTYYNNNDNDNKTLFNKRTAFHLHRLKVSVLTPHEHR
jgi:hypothetical protein